MYNFTPGEISIATYWIGGRVVPRIGLDNVEKWKSYPYRVSNSDSSTVHPLASRYTDWERRRGAQEIVSQLSVRRVTLEEEMDPTSTNPSHQDVGRQTRGEKNGCRSFKSV